MQLNRFYARVPIYFPQVAKLCTQNLISWTDNRNKLLETLLTVIKDEKSSPDVHSAAINALACVSKNIEMCAIDPFACVHVWLLIVMAVQVQCAIYLLRPLFLEHILPHVNKCVNSDRSQDVVLAAQSLLQNVSRQVCVRPRTHVIFACC